VKKGLDKRANTCILVDEMKHTSGKGKGAASDTRMIRASLFAHQVLRRRAFESERTISEVLDECVRAWRLSFCRIKRIGGK
jgi:hypothetical protein